MKRKQTKEKRSLREDWRLVKRGIGIWNQILPHFWVWHVLCTLAETIAPYFGLYMSAQMVNELAGNCEVKRLLILAGITVGGGFFLSLMIKLLQCRRELTDCLMMQRHEAFMIDAQNGFQYAHLENPEVFLLRSRIFAAMNATGAGLMEVKWQVMGMFVNILHILFSASLTVSMFTMVAQGEYTGMLAFLNSPVSSVVLLVLLFVNIVFDIQISNKHTTKYQEAVSKLAEANVRLGVNGSLGGADLRMFQLNRIVLDDYRKYNLRPNWLAKTQKVDITYGSLNAVLDAVQNIVIFLFTAAKAFIGAFGIGNLILYQGTIDRFVGGISELASNIACLRHNNQYLVQLYEYLDLPNDMYKGTLAVEKRDDIDYEIEFRDVSFKYPRTNTWALQHVNTKFKIGDKLAIVGENGSGKTTFIKLLCRLYDPTEGKILLNGIDITRYRYDEYMMLFSVVFQDYSLFAFPLGENVAANRIYDATKVRDCLIRAGLGDKLASLDNDKETKMSTLERAIGREYDSEGIDFSGGEMQKIALARALYKDAPFVILDEPTAALDPVAEAAVYENFNRIVENKTAVFISHRLSSCRFCDSIAVFDHGQLVQQGSHDALVADEEGKYCKLWHAQAQYYTKG